MMKKATVTNIVNNVLFKTWKHCNYKFNLQSFEVVFSFLSQKKFIL